MLTRTATVFGFLLCLAGACLAGDAPLPDATKTWLDANTVRVATLDISAPYEDLMPLKSMLQGVQILMMGEESHADGAAFLAKARLVRFLHEQMGFNVLAFEAGLPECDRANQSVRQNRLASDAMRDCLHNVWCVREVEPLFDYVLKTQGSPEPIRLAGFDNQETGRLYWMRVPGALHFVEGLVSLTPEDRQLLTDLGNTHLWTALESDKLWAQQGALSRLCDGFRAARPALVSKYGAAATDWQDRYLHNIGSNLKLMIARSLGAEDLENDTRDSEMADNLRWLADTAYSGEKIICWAHTFHIMHGTDDPANKSLLMPRGTKVMGNLIKQHFGDQAYALGFAAHHGKMGAQWLRTPTKMMDIRQPPTGSIEDVMHRYGQALLFVNLRVPGPFNNALSGGCMYYTPHIVNWTQVLDGILFTDEMTPATPMQ
jgi:erythromycin esterase